MIIFVIEILCEGEWRALESCAWDTASAAATAANEALRSHPIPEDAWRVEPHYLGLCLDVQA